MIINVLVTGANGFIGRVLCDKLITDGYQVRGAVRSATQMTALLSVVEGALVGDIGPKTDRSEALDGIEGIVHLAAKTNLFPGGKKEKYPLDIPDLKSALLYAEQDIKDRWKWYRDRYRKRLKK